MLIRVLVVIMVTSGDSRLIETDKSLSYHRHLAACVLNIVEENFDIDLPVVIQTPEMWHGKHRNTDDKTISSFGDILLMTINAAGIISYATLGFTEGMNKRSLNKLKPGSYIIVVSGEHYSVIPMIRDMMIRIWHDARNRAAKILIVHSEALDGYNERVQAAGDYMMLSWRIALLTNVVVVIPRKVPSTDSEEEDLFHFYAYNWLTHKQRDLCSVTLNHVNIVALWTTDFQKSLRGDLFPSKKLTDMKKCRLVIRIHEMYPLIYFEEETNELTGMFADYLTTEAETANIRPEYVLEFPNPHLDFPGVYDEDYEECKLTYPYSKMEITWIVPSGAPAPRWKSIIKAFNFNTWCLIGVNAIFGFIIFWLFAILSNTSKSTQYETRLSRYLMNSLQTHLAIGVNYEPTGPIPVIFFTLWLFYCLQIYTLYQSSIIGYLLHPGELAPFKNMEELEKSGLKKLTMLKFSRSTNSVLVAENNYTLCSHVCFERIISQRDIAILDDRFHAKVFIHSIYSTSGKPKAVALEDDLMILLLGVLVNGVGCLLHNTLEETQRRLFSSGIMDWWNGNIERRIVMNYYNALKVEKYTPLELSHLQGAFYILIIGQFLGMIVFLIEILFWNIQYRLCQ